MMTRGASWVAVSIVLYGATTATIWRIDVIGITFSAVGGGDLLGSAFLRITAARDESPLGEFVLGELPCDKFPPKKK